MHLFKLKFDLKRLALLADFDIRFISTSGEELFPGQPVHVASFK